MRAGGDLASFLTRSHHSNVTLGLMVLQKKFSMNFLKLIYYYYTQVMTNILSFKNHIDKINMYVAMVKDIYFFCDKKFPFH
jgi:hypothetical protein